MRVRDFLQLWRGNFEIIDREGEIICISVMDPNYNMLRYEKIQSAWFCFDGHSQDHIMVIRIDT